LPRRPVCKHSVAGSRPRARRHHYWIGAALAALALASPLAIAAAPAAAQGIQFNSVGGDGSGDLTVTVTSDYPLTDWTLSLSNANGTYTLDDFTDFTDESGTFTADVPQKYVLNASAAQQDLETELALPLGSYTATATGATDSNGDTLPSSQTLAGTFNFLAQPTLTINGSTYNTTQPNQAVTINGQITGCTTTTLVCPTSWSGTSVIVTDVTASAQPFWTGATTDSSGDFSVTGVTGVPGDNYSASVAATSTTSAATSPAAQDVPQYAPTLIMASAATAPYGKQTIKGTLSYQSGLQQVAAPAGVTITATAGSHTVSTTTSDSGAFSLTVPPIAGTTTWLLKTQNDLSTSPFLAGTESSVGASQQWQTAITKFTAEVTPYPPGGALLTVSGCVVSTTTPPPSDASDPPVELEWRARRTAKWQEVGDLSTGTEPGCAGLEFSGSGPPKALSAYYRVAVIADATYAGSTSASSGRVWIYQTRFDPFDVTPHLVAAGKKIKVSGTLQYYGSKWRALANQRVYIIFSYNRKNWFVIQRRVQTNSKGAFSLTIADTYGTAYWSANYQGDKTHLEVSASTPRVRVHG
jgi:hypothetical protein